MKKLAIVFFTVALTGCASVIPSFWDDNQSAKIVDAQVKIQQLDCSQPHFPQVAGIHNDLVWFEVYSKSKGKMQNDVVELVKPLSETVEAFYDRSKAKQGSVTYCEGKKEIMIEQVNKVAEGVLGRW